MSSRYLGVRVFGTDVLDKRVIVVGRANDYFETVHTFRDDVHCSMLKRFFRSLSEK